MAITDIGGATPIIQTGNGYGDGMFGNSWLGIILIIALLGGGLGYGFGNRGYGMGADFNGAFTRSDMQDGFNNQTVQNKLDSLGGRINSIGDGICDATFALNNSVKDGFYSTVRAIDGVNTNLGNALCTTTYELAGKIDANRFASQQCCCDIQRAIDGINFNAERNTSAVIQNATANTQRILDYLSAKELADKNQQIFEMSQKAQTAEIIASMKPVAPIPAYIQPSPYEAYRVNSYGCGCYNNGYAFV